MAKNYKIKVKVEIVESDQEAEVELVQTEDGQFELVISEDQAISIDDCEQALLRTNYPAIRAAIAKHLTELSKKKQLKKPIQAASRNPKHIE
jgi:spermidine/putrescine-binding protein